MEKAIRVPATPEWQHFNFREVPISMGSSQECPPRTELLPACSQPRAGAAFRPVFL